MFDARLQLKLRKRSGTAARVYRRPVTVGILSCLFLLALLGNIEHDTLGVRGYIALAGLWAAPVSGTSMNPARSFGPGAGQWRLDRLLSVRRRPADRRGDRPSGAPSSCAAAAGTRSPTLRVSAC
ncbi:MAG: hypothetical protein ACLP4R_05590 [Solirubrobacteraceae bacterium]